MITRNLARRLERLEVELTPSGDEPVLTIIVTSPGEPNEIIELRGVEPTGVDVLGRRDEPAKRKARG